MTQSLPDAGLGALPTIPYRNVAAMADWLCNAFGFQKRSVARDNAGGIKHAQLAFGDSTIMVFPVQDFASEKLVAHPDEVGGLETQACYLVVADVEAHFARAKANGAEIIFGVKGGRYGGKGYASRDPEGHVWMFGTHDPRKAGSLAVGSAPARQQPSPRTYALAVAVAALAAALAGTGFWAYRAVQGPTVAVWSAPRSAEAMDRRGGRDAESEAKDLAGALTETRTAKDRAEQKASELTAQLAQENAAAKSAQQREQEMRQLLTRVLSERDDLAQTAKELSKHLAQAHMERDAATAAAKDAAGQLEKARLAVAVTERAGKGADERCAQEQARAAKDALDRFTRERNARAAAELAANELRNQLALIGTNPQNVIHELRQQIEAERRSRTKIETEAQDAKLLLVQEKYSRDATERALKQAQQKLASNQASCWSCPSEGACSRPQ